MSFQNLKTALFAVAAAQIMSHSQALAWSNHATITRAALQNVEELSRLEVEYRPFQELLDAMKAAGMDVSTPDKFNEYLLIDKYFRFEDGNVLNESAGSKHTYLDVLASYADEPDRNYTAPESAGLTGRDAIRARSIDVEVFNQYPDNEEMQGYKTKYEGVFGEQTGLGSQFFRHAYMPAWSSDHPIATFRLSARDENVGEAHKRVRVFFDLARKAMELGHPYWALRFMSNGIHYLEDTSSLFHTRRAVTLAYLFYAAHPQYTRYYFGDVNIDIDKPFRQILKDAATEIQEKIMNAITALVSYHHWVFEDYFGQHLETLKPGNTPSAPAAELAEVLGNLSNEFDDLAYVKSDDTKNIEEFVKTMANYSVAKSGEAARATWAFFPDLPEIEEEFKISTLSEFNEVINDQESPKNFLSDTRKPEFVARMVRERPLTTPKGQALLKLVKEIYAPEGYAIRQLILGELEIRQ